MILDIKHASIGLDSIKRSILKVLRNDPKTMPQQVLMHKVFQDLRNQNRKIDLGFIDRGDFLAALDSLVQDLIIGRNKFNKYYIEYPTLSEKDVFGEGYIEIDEKTGNGYITVRKDPREYKKSSHFVHKKNLGGAQHGDYVRFVELKVDSKRISKFALIDAKVKEILLPPKSN